MTLPTLADILAARDRIQGQVRNTPVLTSDSLDEHTDAQVFFKCEVFQRTGSFKFRGASAAVLSLDAGHILRGVATHSSGNHGAALALAARLRGIPAYIVMPSTASPEKLRAVNGYGAEIVECGPTLSAREETLQRVAKKTQAEVVHPYNDRRVIAGQGTLALEFFEQVPDLDTLIVPIGGGGLASGIVLVAKALSPSTRVIGVEPAVADDAQRSLRSGVRQPALDTVTVADGLRAALGDLTFAILHQHLSDIVTVSEESIIAAMRLTWQRLKITVEASAALPVAALLDGQITGRRIGVVLSGGNVELDRLPWLPSI